MDIQKKIKMVDMRLDGYSIRTVGEAVGCSHQMVANYVKAIHPHGGEVDPDNICIPMLTDEERASIAEAIVSCEGDLPKLCHETQKSQEELERLLDYIAVRKPSTCRACIYPAVGTWMRHHMVTVKSLAEGVGVSHPTLSAALSGERHMTMKILEGLRAITGMSYRTILDGHMGPIDEEIERELSVMRASNPEGSLDASTPLARRPLVHPAKEYKSQKPAESKIEEEFPPVIQPKHIIMPPPKNKR